VKAQIFEKALVIVSVDLDTEWAKAEATRKEYLNKMEAHTAHAKHSLGHDKMLGEKKVQLNKRALVEVQSQGLNPHDNREELMEFAECWDSIAEG
jgi:TnpA family transposase